jgi:hypothetical protein
MGETFADISGECGADSLAGRLLEDLKAWSRTGLQHAARPPRREDTE